MNFQKRNDVLAMLLTEKERRNTSWTRSPINVFKGQHMTEFSMLTLKEQSALINHQPCLYDDNLFDSTDTVHNKVKRGDVMRLARDHWRNLPREVIDAWTERTDTMVNAQPRYGVFVTIPNDLDNPCLEDNVQRALTLNFNKF